MRKTKIFFLIINFVNNLESLNIKIVHEREETKADLKNDKTFDNLKDRCQTYEAEETHCDKTSNSNF